MDGPPATDPVPHFTPRELEVLQVMCSADCLLEKQMPDALGMSLSTFKTHKESIFKKCGVNSREQLIEKAMRWRLVPCFCGGPLQHANIAGQPGDTPAAGELTDGKGLSAPLLGMVLWCGILLKMLEFQCQLGGILFEMPEMWA